MPYKSDKQKRFFRACKHGADYDGCPPDDVVDEFEKAEKMKKEDAKKIVESIKLQEMNKDDRWQLYSDNGKGYTVHHIQRGDAKKDEPRFKHTLNGKEIISHSKWIPDEFKSKVNEEVELEEGKIAALALAGTLVAGGAALAKHDAANPHNEKAYQATQTEYEYAKSQANPLTDPKKFRKAFEKAKTIKEA